MGPKSLRVMPDLGLVPGENSQPGDGTYGNACNRPGYRCPCRRPSRGSPTEQQASAGQDRPPETCQVGVSISRNLRAALNDPEYRHEDHYVAHIRRRQAGYPSAEGKDERSDGENQAEAQEER